jgi:hypothetical protein
MKHWNYKSPTAFYNKNCSSEMAAALSKEMETYTQGIIFTLDVEKVGRNEIWYVVSNAILSETDILRCDFFCRGYFEAFPDDEQENMKKKQKARISSVFVALSEPWDYITADIIGVYKTKEAAEKGLKEFKMDHEEDTDIEYCFIQEVWIEG